MFSEVRKFEKNYINAFIKKGIKKKKMYAYINTKKINATSKRTSRSIELVKTVIKNIIRETRSIHFYNDVGRCKFGLDFLKKS